MSEYCSYGDFCKVDLQLNKDDSQHRHHITCPKCKKEFRTSIDDFRTNKEVKAILSKETFLSEKEKKQVIVLAQIPSLLTSIKT